MPLNNVSCGVLRTCSIVSGPKSLSGPHTGRSSGITASGRAGLPGGRRRTGGSAISPARSSINSRPRQTISRSAPLACFQFQASHSFRDKAQRLASGFASGDEPIADAAIAALGKIASPSATKELIKLHSDGDRRTAAAHTLLQSAQELAARGRVAEARSIFERLTT